MLHSVEGERERGKVQQTKWNESKKQENLLGFQRRNNRTLLLWHIFSGVASAFLVWASLTSMYAPQCEAKPMLHLFPPLFASFLLSSVSPFEIFRTRLIVQFKINIAICRMGFGHISKVKIRSSIS